MCGSLTDASNPAGTKGAGQASGCVECDAFRELMGSLSAGFRVSTASGLGLKFPNLMPRVVYRGGTRGLIGRGERCRASDGGLVPRCGFLLEIDHFTSAGAGAAGTVTWRMVRRLIDADSGQGATRWDESVREGPLNVDSGSVLLTPPCDVLGCEAASLRETMIIAIPP